MRALLAAIFIFISMQTALVCQAQTSAPADTKTTTSSSKTQTIRQKPKSAVSKHYQPTGSQLEKSTTSDGSKTQKTSTKKKAKSTPKRTPVSKDKSLQGINTDETEVSDTQNTGDSGEDELIIPQQLEENMPVAGTRKRKRGAKLRQQKLKEKPDAVAEEQPEEVPDESGYYDSSSEDVLNPFSLESVKRHIHKLTAPDEPEKTTTKSHKGKKESKQKKTAPKVKPKPPSEQPFTPEWNQEHGRRVLAIIGVMLLALFGAPPFTRRLVKYMTTGREGSEIHKRVGTTTQLAMKSTLILVLLLGLLEILKEFQVDIGPMLTGAGIFGVALGFAGQSLLKDILAGSLMIIEEQIRVGDFVKIAGITGTVEEISLRKIVLRDFSGNVLYVPNSQVTIVCNMTREFSRYVIDVPIAYKEDFQEVVKVLGEVDEEIRKDPEFDCITEPLTIYGISGFNTNGYTVTVRTTTKPGDQWKAAREYRKRIKERFDELNMEIPVAQISIQSGNGREADAIPTDLDSLKNKAKK